MHLQTASRKRAKIKMAVQGSSGSGKTYSALLLAYGLCGDWSKVIVIDTENESSHLYANLGPYQVLHLSGPFSPERYGEAITIAEKAGAEVIIIDSLSHEWEHLIEYHAGLPGNSFTNWNKVTPRHNQLVQHILQSVTHTICTIRSKSEYVLTEKNGKQVPERVGMKPVQRDGLEYEFALVFELDIKNNATATKDRTGLFFGQPEHRISIETGKKILDWCNSGAVVQATDVTARIQACRTIQELMSIYKMYPGFQKSMLPEFESRKRELLLTESTINPIHHPKPSSNGTVQ